MSTLLGRRQPLRKTGAERLHSEGTELGPDLLSFWQWSASDLVSNATRGVLAEFIVAQALGVSTTGVRDEWAAFDLVTPAGVKVEVKSAAFIQSWHQERLSPISFLTRATRAWDADTNTQSREAKRQADVYVFALLAHADKATMDPLDVGQWRFFVLASRALNARTRSQHSITLSSLEALCGGSVAFINLAASVARAVSTGGLPDMGSHLSGPGEHCG